MSDQTARIAPENCSLVRALGVVGERWTLLLLRQAFHGVSRFDEMQSQLGVSRKVLAARLERMVADGLLARVPYRVLGQRPRHEYWLTDKGQELATALVALMQWGDRHMAQPGGPPLRIIDRDSGQAVRAALVRADGAEVAGLAALASVPWPERTPD